MVTVRPRMRYNVRVPDVEVYFEADALLGESPVWDERLIEFQWVDIKRGEIHRLDHSSRVHSVVELGESVGAIVPTSAGDGWIAGLRDRVAEIDFQGTARRSVSIDADRPSHRMNDGMCDSVGRFWTGTLDEADGPVGDALYCVDTNLNVRTAVTGIGLSNGIGWSPDDRMMYRVDSANGTIYRSEFDAGSGTRCNETPFVVIDPEHGEPDGLAVDANGGIWVALWGGGLVRRYTPAGMIDREVHVPVSRPTSCTFGGPELTTMFITSAKVGLSDEQLLTEPLAGSIFSFDAAVGGLALNRFRSAP